MYDNYQMFDQNNQLYCFTMLDTGTQETNIQKVYEFQNNNWNLIYTIINNPLSNLIGFNYFNNNFYIRKKIKYDTSSSLYRFTGNDFIDILDLNKFQTFTFNGCFTGLNENEILSDGFLIKDTTFDLFNWNGNKWSRELKINYGPNYTKAFLNKYIVIYAEDSPTFILIGRRK